MGKGKLRFLERAERALGSWLQKVKGDKIQRQPNRELEREPQV